MEPAPIPPHERSWRHPSELGPTHVEPGGSGRQRAVLLAGGTLAVAMVAALVVAMTPRESTAPAAVSATTVAATDPSARAVDRTARIASAPAIPTAIVDVAGAHAALAGGSLPDASAAAVLPDLDDEVVVLTDHVAYALPWRDVALLSVEDAVVVDADGAIVARFESGRLVVSADAVVGAALTVAED